MAEIAALLKLYYITFSRPKADNPGIKRSLNPCNPLLSDAKHPIRGLDPMTILSCMNTLTMPQWPRPRSSSSGDEPLRRLAV